MHKRLCRNLPAISVIVLIIIAIILPPCCFPQSVSANADPPDIWLPTPVGETWEVRQGFYCGTHDNEREIDFSRSNGSTTGAPVRAAADGVVNFWTASSGTLLIDHGNDYYTEYTHLSDAFSTVPGTPAFQGQEIGHVNDYDHLHFSFYHSPSGSYFNRTTLELDFLDGYSFHDTSGCNQHFGEEFVAKDNPDTTPPTIAFTTELEADRWYCKDHRIEFTIDDDRQIRGFSQKFNGEPEGDQPEFEGDAGYVQLAWAKEGMHTLSIRAWDRSGNVRTESFGPIGYDATPPTIDKPHPLPEHIYRTGTFSLSWKEANDGKGSGIAGYNYYLGTDPTGTSNQFTDSNSVEVPDVAPGCYVLRIQAHDNACGSSDWVTIQNVVVNDKKGTMPVGACESGTDSTSKETPSDQPDLDDTQPAKQKIEDVIEGNDTMPLQSENKEQDTLYTEPLTRSEAAETGTEETEAEADATGADDTNETNNGEKAKAVEDEVDTATTDTEGANAEAGVPEGEETDDTTVEKTEPVEPEVSADSDADEDEAMDVAETHPTELPDVAAGKQTMMRR